MEPGQISNPSNANTARPLTIRLSPVLYLLATLLFFLPFVDFRCNDVSLQQVSGINLATGFKIKTTGNGSLFDKLSHPVNEDVDLTANGENRDLNVYALVALITGIAGLIISLLSIKYRELLGIITGVGAAAALIGLMADLKSQVKLNISAKADSANLRLTLDFTPWFYIAILLFLTAAFLSFLAVNKKT